MPCRILGAIRFGGREVEAVRAAHRWAQKSVDKIIPVCYNKRATDCNRLLFPNEGINANENEKSEVRVSDKI